MPFVKSKPPLPTRSRFLRGTVRSTIMPASCPSFCCNFRKKHLSHAEKQRVWSRSCVVGFLRGGCSRGGGNGGTLRIPGEDWGTLGNIREA